MRCLEGPPDVSPARAACDDRCVADGARGRREAIRQLADLRRKLAAAEDALTDALAAMKQADERASATADRLARRVRDLAESLDRPAELGGSPPGRARHRAVRVF